MLIWENIILAINGLLSNKMRAILTMLGIIIGIGAVIAIITVGNSLTLSVSENMQSMGANNINVVVQPKSTSEDEYSKIIEDARYGSFNTVSEMSEDNYITEEMIHDMCDKFSDEIYAVNVQYTVGSGTAEIAQKTANINLTGNSVGSFITANLNILGGHLFSESDFQDRKNVAIVSDKLVKKLFDDDIGKALGKEISINVSGKTENFTILGVYEYEETYMMGMNMSGDNVVTDCYIPLKSALNFAHEKAHYPYIEVITKVGVNADELSSKIKNFFGRYYENNRESEVLVFTLSSMISSLTDMLSTITVAISVIAGIALLVGGIGVMNIMLVSVTERTREIGTRKAIGAKNSSIRTQFIVEAMIICLVGGIFGVILGIGGGVLASSLLGYPAQPSISSIIISLLFSMSIGIFFGYYPANKAAKMNPIDSLRYE